MIGQAIKPHCVVCGYESDGVGSIAFADYDPRWWPPLRHDGAQIVGWQTTSVLPRLPVSRCFASLTFILNSRHQGVSRPGGSLSS